MYFVITTEYIYRDGINTYLLLEKRIKVIDLMEDLEEMIHAAETNYSIYKWQLRIDQYALYTTAVNFDTDDRILQFHKFL